MARSFGDPNSTGRRLFEQRSQGYDLNATPVSAVAKPVSFGRFGATRYEAAPLPMPSTADVMRTGQVVSISPENYARSFVPSTISAGKEIGGGQALFIHPQTGKWVSFAELPVGPGGLRQSLGQQDGNPYVNRSGTIDVAHRPEESAWVEFRNSAVPVLAAAAPIAAAALAPAAAASIPSAATAGAAATAPEIGAGLFAGGAEAAAAGGGGFLGGGTGGFLGFGGATGTSTLPGFTVPTLGASSAGAGTLQTIANATKPVQQVAGAISQAAGGGQAQSGGGILSGLMSWLGSPTGQAVSQLGGAALQGATAQRAAEQQAAVAQAGIDEQRRQFEAMRSGLAPFQQAGTQALGGFAPFQQAGQQAFQQQQALAGLQGQQAQQQAIGTLEASPLYQSLARQGEEAILQRASATGGLRGGNVQAALAQFRPAMLQQLIDQQYSRLGGLAGTGLGVTERLATMGQSAAGLQGQSGINVGSNIGNLLAQQGQAQAGGTLGISQGIGQALNIPQQMAAQERAGRLFDMMSKMYGVQ